MSQPSPIPEDFVSLLSAACDDALAESQVPDLEALLASDPRLRAVFVDHFLLETDLQFLGRTKRACHGGLAGVRETFRADSTPRLESPAVFPVLDNPVHVASGVCFSGWPVAYLIASVIFAVGLAVGAFVHVSQQPRVVLPSSVHGGHHEVVRGGGEGGGSSRSSSIVGRITAMVDCVWEDQVGWGKRSAAPPNNTANHQSGIRNQKSLLRLGDCLALNSGLLEITYDSGAKVVLQGPVRYEIESSTGGYLSIGKLTAKLEKKSEVRGQRSEAANQKSEIRIHTFTVRTPTATITDLGTEFGVEVDRSGSTSTYVFRGLVEVQTESGDGGKRGKAVRLGKNQSLAVKPQNGNTPEMIVRNKVDAQAFVRVEQLPRLVQEQRLKPLRRWQAYREQLRNDPALVAYYTFEPVQGKPDVLSNLSAAGRALDGQIEGPEWVLGRLPGKSALFFHGPKSGDKVALPDPDRFNFPGAFSIAVWFRVMQFAGSHEGLVTKGNQSWRFQQSSERTELKFDTNYGPKLEHGLAGKTEVADRRWHLGVAVYEPVGNTAHKRLFVDGRLDVANESPLSLNRTEHPVWLGANSGYPGLEFQGWIDEVAIFGRALSAGEVRKMFEAGDPAGLEREGNSRTK